MNKQQQEQQLYEIETKINQIKDNIRKNFTQLSKEDIKIQNNQILSYNDEANNIRLQLHIPLINNSDLESKLEYEEPLRLKEKKVLPPAPPLKKKSLPLSKEEIAKLEKEIQLLKTNKEINTNLDETLNILERAKLKRNKKKAQTQLETEEKQQQQQQRQQQQQQQQQLETEEKQQQQQQLAVPLSNIKQPPSLSKKRNLELEKEIQILNNVNETRRLIEESNRRRDEKKAQLQQEEVKRLEEERRRLEEEKLQQESICLQNKQNQLQKQIKIELEDDAIDDLINLYSEPVIKKQTISSNLAEETKEDPCLNEKNDYVGIGIYTDKINNCYINAALQMLYQMCYFRNSLINNSNLEELKDHRSDDIQEDAVFTLQYIFDKYSKMLAPFKEALTREDFTSEYIPFDIINDLISVIKRIKLVPPADPVTDDSQDDPTDLISNLLNAVDLKTNNISNHFVFGENNQEGEKALPFKYIYSLNINNTNFSNSNIYLSNIIENDNAVKTNLKDALTPDLPFFLPSQKYLIFNLNRRYYSVEEDRMKKYNYDVTPDPILQICEDKFVLRGALVHLGTTANQGHYVYVTFGDDGHKISGIYNNQLIGIFKPDKFIYFNFIVKNGQPETSLPTINTNPEEYILEINTIKENVEKNGYIYLYERVDEPEPKVDEEKEKEIFPTSEADTEAWFKKLLNYLKPKEWFEELLDRMKRPEPIRHTDVEIEGSVPLIIPIDFIADIQGDPSEKSSKDFFIKLLPIWLKQQNEPIIDKTTEILEKEVTTFSNQINQEWQGLKYIKAISNFLTKVNKQPLPKPLTKPPPKFELTVLDGIILAKNILNIPFEISVTKTELRNYTNKLLYMIEYNSIPKSNNRKKLIKIAYNFLIEIPENLTKMPAILQLQYKNNNQSGIEMKRREKEKKEREINAFLLKNNWQNLKKILDLMAAEKYKELNLKDTTIVLRSRIHNKTMKNINNASLCMKYKSGNICKEIGQLTPIIITERGYPSQIRKLTKKVQLEIIDKNVKDRKEKAKNEKERIENEKITNQLQNQIKSLENLKDKVNIINNEDIKKQIEFYTRKLNYFNDILLDPDQYLTDENRLEIENIKEKTTKIQKLLQNKLQGGKRITRKKKIHLRVRKNKTRNK
jgi:hypothetical protein